jgi:hypothetical protein
MNQPFQNNGQDKSVQRQKDLPLRKILWHIRWILLVLLMIFNICVMNNRLAPGLIIGINGFSFALYLLFKQVEGYMECKAECKINR